MAIENDFDADGRRPGTGVGLANVPARLESSYGERARLTVATTDTRFRAGLWLPLEEAS